MNNLVSHPDQPSRKRRGRWRALVIAGGIHGLLLFGLSMWHSNKDKPDREPGLILYRTPSPEPAHVQVPVKTLNTAERPPAPPPAHLSVLAVKDLSTDPPMAVPDSSASDIGLLEGGFAMGESTVSGGGFGGSLPPPPRRPKATQSSSFKVPVARNGGCFPNDELILKRIIANGGTEACEAAVVKALAWLAACQNDDGSWGSKFTVKMTSLALLAFFGHCELPGSQPYGENVERGLLFLVEHAMQREDGYLISNGLSPLEQAEFGGMEHALGGLALSRAVSVLESAGIRWSHRKELQQALLSSVSFALGKQCPHGGFFWAARQIVDCKHHEHHGAWVSHWVIRTTWQLHSLQAFSETGLDGQPTNVALRKGLEFLNANTFERSDRGAKYLRKDGGNHDRSLIHVEKYGPCLLGQVDQAWVGKAMERDTEDPYVFGYYWYDFTFQKAETEDDLPSTGSGQIILGGNMDRFFLRVFDDKGHVVFNGNSENVSNEARMSVREELEKYRGNPIRLRLALLLGEIAVAFELDSYSCYEIYMNTLACHLYGGKIWERWNGSFLDQILRAQREDGAWRSREPESDFHFGSEIRSEGEDALISWTSLLTLTLQIYYDDPAQQ